MNIYYTEVGVDGTVRAWVDGWVVSRGASPPLVEPWGYTIDMGLAHAVTRHVLDTVNDDVEERTVRKVADAVTGAGVWLKVFDDPARVGGWLGDGWSVDPDPGYLMSVPLTASEAPAVPDGYRVRVWTRGGVTRVMLAGADGSWAARGQIAPTGRTAVVDQVATSAAHRRRGLGTFVMRTLVREAFAQGAERGVLAGTPDGRALYEALGWRVEAPLTSAHFTGAETEPSGVSALPAAWSTATSRPPERPGPGV
ncbi:GNAT family N-acetyltransferase [Streptomyces sp. NBC_01538]|uniref:GNAT family N-acetyltransferase n=1 Tax=Streptomyces sp. NBC_01538 TaxID=2903897 RepID=UPI0038703160